MTQIRIPKFFKSPFLVYFFWISVLFLGIFEGLRLLLLVFNHSDFRHIPALVLMKSFLVGARFDLSITLMTIAPLFLLNYLFYLANWRRKLRIVNLIYLTLFASLYVFLGISEIEFFRYFQVRLNSFFINWGENPAFVIKMIWESYPVVWYILGIVLLVSLIFLMFKKLQDRYYRRSTEEGFFLKITAFVLAVPLIFLGIRGTLSYKTPLRWGHAYFSSYNFANQLALNGVYTLANDIIYQKTDQADLQKLLGIADRRQAYNIVEKMSADSTGVPNKFPLRTYKFGEDSKPYNVVIFLLESYSDYDIRKYEKEGIPLFFNRIKDKGIYFPNFYSNGFHTYIGLFSSLFGMPNVYGKSVLKQNIGQQEFSGLLNILRKKGYTGYFGVSHDPNFDNMAGFLRGNGVDHVISQFDFHRDEVLSSLGVADHKLFEKMNEQFRNAREPFFGVVLSTNNHGPWIIPQVPGKEFRSTFHYTDWALEHFFDLAAHEKYFRNTIFIITGDHGRAETSGYDFNLQLTHIPCLIYNPDIIKPEIVKNVTGQIDLSQTILGQLKMDYRTTNLGRDVLHMPNQFGGYALMQEGKMLGFIWNDWYLIDHIDGTPELYRYQSENTKHNFAAEKPEVVKKLQQKARALYFVGNDMIFNRKAAPSAWK